MLSRIIWDESLMGTIPFGVFWKIVLLAKLKELKARHGEYMLVVLALRKLRQKDCHMFKASLCHIMSARTA